MTIAAVVIAVVSTGSAAITCRALPSAPLYSFTVGVTSVGPIRMPGSKYSWAIRAEYRACEVFLE